jgi:hypothetical protein
MVQGQARRARSALCLTVIAVLSALLGVSCGSDRRDLESHGASSEALNSAPKISDFAIFAQRSVSLGSSDSVTGGDVGVSAKAASSFGVQLKVAASATVQTSHNLLAPSVSLASQSHVGDVQTNSLTNNGGTLGTLATFPSSSMPLPLAAAATGNGGSNVSVPAFTITVLNPGNYGTLSVVGTVLLNAGSYTFSSVTMADQAHLGVVSGTANVSVGGTFSAGQSVTISSPGFQPAGQLVISVAGSDSNGVPAFSIGPSGGISALLYAPHGTLSVGNSTIATGAFGGFDVTFGTGVTITYQSGFTTALESPHGTQQLTGYATAALAAAQLVGPVPQSTPIAVAVGLPVPNLQAVKTFVQQASNPANPSTFRQYLTPSQFAANYGPTASTYQNLVSWAQIPS